MTFLDLFAGIGGFRRGLELAGHECVGFCEWDKYAAASYTAMHLLTDEQREKLAALPLKQRQKEIIQEEYRNGEWYASDIRDVCAGAMPKADCWTFGAPCQDFSVAGTRSGMAGERSSLVREVFRLLRETEAGDRPEWLIYENVKGILARIRVSTTYPFYLKWRSWGMMSNGRFSTARIGACPRTARECTLSDILERKVDRRYFLSREQMERINLKQNRS